MSELPPGWVWTTIDDIAGTSLGKMLDKKKTTGIDPTPYLRNINVRWGRFDLSDLASMDIRPDELDRVLARPGDVIACEGGEPGRAAVWRGPGTIALQKAFHRIRPTEAVDPNYLALYLRHLAGSRALESLFTGTTIKHLPQEKLRLVGVPLPPRTEQERIVAAIEEQFSRLEMAEKSLRGAQKRIEAMQMLVLALATPFEAEPQTLGALLPSAAVFSDGDWVETKDQDATGGVRLTQLADIGVGEWRNRSRRFMRLDRAKEMGCTFLESGDVLVARMPEPLGRACIFPGDEKLAVTAVDVCILRPNPEIVDPRWLMWALNSPSSRVQVLSMQSGTTRKRISRRNLGTVLLPTPPIEEQRRLASEIDQRHSVLADLRTVIDRAFIRSSQLRCSILSMAFSGRLVDQDPSDTPVAQPARGAAVTTSGISRSRPRQPA